MRTLEEVSFATASIQRVLNEVMLQQQQIARTVDELAGVKNYQHAGIFSDSSLWPDGR